MVPLLRIVSSTTVSFPGKHRARRVICHRIIDALYIISLRIGFEMTRENMTFVLQKFFAAFNRVYDSKFLENKQMSSLNAPENEGQEKENDPNGEMYFEIKMDSETKEYRIGTQILPEKSYGHKRTPSGTIKLSLSPSQDEEGMSSISSFRLHTKPKYIDKYMWQYSTYTITITVISGIFTIYRTDYYAILPAVLIYTKVITCMIFSHI